MKNWLWFFVLIAIGTQAQTYTVETVPNIKLVDNNYVSDPDNLLGADAISQINLKLGALEQQTSAQVAVVMLTSIGTETDVDFAQNLFQLWGIGKSGNDNGLLILYVQDQRTIRLHTGYGLEGVLPDAICKRIQTQVMVPHFREGNTDAGILAGVDEVIKIVTLPEYFEEVYSEETSQTSWLEWGVRIFIGGWAVVLAIVFFANLSTGFSDSKKVSTRLPSASLSIGQWLLFVFLAPLALAYVLGLFNSWIVFLAGLYAYLDLLVFARYQRIISSTRTWLSKGKVPEAQEFLKEENVWAEWALLFPLPFAFLSGRYRKFMNELRTQPRPCSKCGNTMQLLKNSNENNFLTEQQQFEEKINSIAYDVWTCPACSHVQVQNYPNEKGQYQKCPSCRTRALQSTFKTIKAASHTETGLQKKSSVCKYCNHTEERELIIPKKEKRAPVTAAVSSTSKRQRDDSDDNWSNDRSDDSDSRGGSWGGGDSGGGGASSKW